MAYEMIKLLMGIVIIVFCAIGIFSIVTYIVGEWNDLKTELALVHNKILDLEDKLKEFLKK